MLCGMGVFKAYSKSSGPDGMLNVACKYLGSSSDSNSETIKKWKQKWKLSEMLYDYKGLADDAIIEEEGSDDNEC